MKRRSLAIPLLMLMILLVTGCSRSRMEIVDGKIYRARFEIKGICQNFTFSVVGGDIDSNLVETSWTNPITHKTYNNAFGIYNPCDLPAGLHEGDEFNFGIIRSVQAGNCIACLVYYPTPNKKLYIRVIK